MRTYLLRFLIAVLTVPAAFALCAFAAVRSGADAPQAPAAAAAAVTFALVVTAPSTKNAAMRALVAVAFAALSLAVVLLLP